VITQDDLRTLIGATAYDKGSPSQIRPSKAKSACRSSCRGRSGGGAIPTSGPGRRWPVPSRPGREEVVAAEVVVGGSRPPLDLSLVIRSDSNSATMARTLNTSRPTGSVGSWNRSAEAELDLAGGELGDDVAGVGQRAGEPALSITRCPSRPRPYLAVALQLMACIEQEGSGKPVS